MLSVNLPIDVDGLYAQTDNPAILTFEVESSKPEKSCNIYLAADTTGENNALKFASITLLDSNGKSIGLTDYEIDETRIHLFGAFTVTAGTYTAYVYAEDETAGNFQLNIFGDNYDSKLDLLVEATLYQEKHYSLFESNKAAYADPTNEKYLGEEYQAALNKKSGEEGNLWDLYKSIVDINKNEIIDEVDLSKARSYAKLGNASLKGEVVVWAQDRTPPTIAFTHDYGTTSNTLTMSVADVSGVKADSVKYSIGNGTVVQTTLDITTGKIVLDSKEIPGFDTCSITVWATDTRGNTEEITYTWLAWEAPVDIVAPTPAILGEAPVAVPAILDGYSFREIGGVSLAGLEGSGTIDDGKGNAIGTLAYGTGSEAGTLFFTPDENYFADLVPGEIASRVFNVTIATGTVSYETTLTFYVQKSVAAALLPSLADGTEDSLGTGVNEGGKETISASEIGDIWSYEAAWLLGDLEVTNIDNRSADEKYDATDYLRYISLTAGGDVVFDATDDFFTALGEAETLAITYSYRLSDRVGKSEDTGYLVFTVNGTDQDVVVTGLGNTGFEIVSNDQKETTKTVGFGDLFDKMEISDPDTVDQAAIDAGDWEYSFGNVMLEGVAAEEGLLTVTCDEGSGIPVSFAVDTLKLPEGSSVLTFDLVIEIPGEPAKEIARIPITVDCLPEAAPTVEPAEWELTQNGGNNLVLTGDYDFSRLDLVEGKLPAGLDVDDLFTLTEKVLSFTPGDHFKYLKDGETLDLTLEYTATDGLGLDGTGLVFVTITGTNDEPFFKFDGEVPGIEAAAGATTAIDLDVYFGDPDGEKLQVTKINDVSFRDGVAEVDDYGVFVFDYVTQTLYFTPDGMFDSWKEGDKSIGKALALTVSDGNGETASDTIPLTIAGTNRPPVVVEQTIEGAFDTLQIIHPGGIATDPNGDGLAFVSVTIVDEGDEIALDESTPSATLASGIEITLAEDGTLTIDGTGKGCLPCDEVETLVFTITVTDGKTIPNTGTGTVTVTLSGTNHAPVVSEKDFFGSDGEDLSIGIGDIVDDKNDEDSHAFVSVEILDENGEPIEDGDGPIVLKEGNLSAILVSGTEIALDPAMKELTISGKLLEEKEETLRFVVAVTDESGAANAGGAGTITVTRYAVNFIVPVPEILEENIARSFDETDDAVAAAERAVDLAGNIDGDSDDYEITWLGLAKAEHDPGDETGAVVVTDEWLAVLGDFCTFDEGTVRFSAPEDYFASLKAGEELALTYAYLVTDPENGTFVEGIITVTITGKSTDPTPPAVSIDLGSVAEKEGVISKSFNVAEDLFIHWTNFENTGLETVEFAIDDVTVDGTVDGVSALEIRNLLENLELEMQPDGTVVISTEENSALQKLGAGQSATVSAAYKINGIDDTFTFTIEGTNDAPLVDDEDMETVFTIPNNSSSATPMLDPGWNVTDPDSNHDGKFSYLISKVEFQDGEIENPGFTVDSEGRIAIAKEYRNKLSGEYVLTVAIFDLKGGETTQEITIHVETYPKPVLLDVDNLSITEEETAALDLTGFIDGYIDDGSCIFTKKPGFISSAETFAWPDGVSKKVYSFEDGVFTFTPNGHFDYLKAGDSLELTFQFKVAFAESEGYSGLATTGTFTVTITGKNTIPKQNGKLLDINVNQGKIKSGKDILSTWSDPDLGEDEELSVALSSMEIAENGFTGFDDMDDEALTEWIDDLQTLLDENDDVLIYENGAFTFKATDTLWKRLGYGQSVAITATYTVSDGQDGTGTGTFTITVNGANDKPVMEDFTVARKALALNDDYSAEGGKVLLATYTATDADWNDTVSYNISVLFGEGELDEHDFDIDADGNITIAAAAVAKLDEGVYTISVNAADGRENSFSKTKSFAITVGNKPIRNDVPDGLESVSELLGRIASVTAPDVENGIPGFLEGRWDTDGTFTLSDLIVFSVDDNNEGENEITEGTLEILRNYLLAEEPGYTLKYSKKNDTLQFSVPKNSPLQMLGLGQSITVTITYAVSNNFGKTEGTATIVINGAADAPDFELNVTDSLIRAAGSVIQLADLVVQGSYTDVDDNSDGSFTLAVPKYPSGWEYDETEGTLTIAAKAKARDYTFTLCLTDPDGGTTSKRVAVTVPNYGPYVLKAVEEENGAFKRDLNIVGTLETAWGVAADDISDFEICKVEDTGKESVSPELLEEIRKITESWSLDATGKNKTISITEGDDADLFWKLGKYQAVTLTISCNVATGVEGETVQGFVTLVINGQGNTEVEIFTDEDREDPLDKNEEGQYILEVAANAAKTIPLYFGVMNEIDDNAALVTYKDVRLHANYPLPDGFGFDAKTGMLTIPELDADEELTLQVRTVSHGNIFVTILVTPL